MLYVDVHAIRHIFYAQKMVFLRICPTRSPAIKPRNPSCLFLDDQLRGCVLTPTLLRNPLCGSTLDPGFVTDCRIRSRVVGLGPSSTQPLSPRTPPSTLGSIPAKSPMTKVSVVGSDRWARPGVRNQSETRQIHNRTLRRSNVATALPTLATWQVREEGCPPPCPT